MSEQIRNVVHYGPDTFITGGRVDARPMSYAEQLAQLWGGLVVVSSGIVEAGELLAKGLGSSPENEIKDPTVLAMVGGTLVPRAWQQSFMQYGKLTAHIPANTSTVRSPNYRPSALELIGAAIARDVVPVLAMDPTLNRARHAQGVGFVDNGEALAAHVAIATKSLRLCLMNDLGGLPDSEGKIVAEVPYNLQARSKVEAMADDLMSRSPAGSSYVHQLAAAIAASKMGIEAYIAGAEEPFEDIFAKHSGTYFEPNPDIIRQ